MRTIDVTVFLLVLLVACCSAMKLDLQSLLRHREMYAPAHKRAKDGKGMILFDVFLGLWKTSDYLYGSVVALSAVVNFYYYYSV